MVSTQIAGCLTRVPRRCLIPMHRAHCLLSKQVYEIHRLKLLSRTFLKAPLQFKAAQRRRYVRGHTNLYYRISRRHPKCTKFRHQPAPLNENHHSQSGRSPHVCQKELQQVEAHVSSIHLFWQLLQFFCAECHPRRKPGHPQSNIKCDSLHKQHVWPSRAD